MTKRRHLQIAVAVAVSTLISLGTLCAAGVVVVLIANADPGFALSDAFFWASAIALVAVHLAAGTLAGLASVTRLAGAGIQGRSRLVAVAGGPAVLALITNLIPVEGIPVILGTVVPVTAAIGGALWGLRMADSRERASSYL